MPTLLLRPGLKRTAVLSLSAAGATGLSYLYAAPDTKDALQVRHLCHASTCYDPSRLSGPGCHFAGGRCPWRKASITDRGSKHSPLSFFVSSVVRFRSGSLTAKCVPPLLEGSPFRSNCPDAPSVCCVLLAERALNTLAAAVTDWSEDKSKREALVQIGRSVLIKWLLSRALDQSHNLEQVEAEHALLNLLADGEGSAFVSCTLTHVYLSVCEVLLCYYHGFCAATTASAVLNCEGALPKLLQLLRHTSDAEKLAGRLLTASAQVTLTQVPSLDEIKKVIDSVSCQKANAQPLVVHSCILITPVLASL